VLPSPEDGNRCSFQNAVFSSISNSGGWKKSRNPVILSVTHCPQNPTERIRFCQQRGLKIVIRILEVLMTRN
jgi:hypothetical protein